MRRFTPEEDAAIVRFVQQERAERPNSGNQLQWRNLDALPGRTAAEVGRRWRRNLRMLPEVRELLNIQSLPLPLPLPRATLHRFTPEEDAAIVQFAESESAARPGGSIRWRRHPLASRTGAALQRRWRLLKDRSLPGIRSVVAFTAEEDAALRASVAAGLSWTEMRINGRTCTALRYRWRRLQAGYAPIESHCRGARFTDEEDLALCAGVAAGLAWSEMRMKGRTGASLRQRWQTLHGIAHRERINARAREIRAARELHEAGGRGGGEKLTNGP